MKTKTPKHTPGPWHYFPDDHDGFEGPSVQSGFGLVVYTLEPGEENEANARLIAAAPDLLAALRYMVEAQNTFFDHADRRASLAKAKEAIAKAEGHE